MANLNGRPLRVLTTLLLLLVVAGLVGHFGVDIGGRELLTACGLHAEFILLSLIAVAGVLTLVTTLHAHAPIHRWRFLPPLTHPPVVLS